MGGTVHKLAVIFEVQPKADRWDQYLGLAKELKPELEKIDGFIDNERFSSRRTKGRLLSLVRLWRDEEGGHGSGRHPRLHHEVQDQWPVGGARGLSSARRRDHVGHRVRSRTDSARASSASTKPRSAPRPASRSANSSPPGATPTEPAAAASDGHRRSGTVREHLPIPRCLLLVSALTRRARRALMPDGAGGWSAPGASPPAGAGSSSAITVAVDRWRGTAILPACATGTVTRSRRPGTGANASARAACRPRWRARHR